MFKVLIIVFYQKFPGKEKFEMTTYYKTFPNANYSEPRTKFLQLQVHPVYRWDPPQTGDNPSTGSWEWVLLNTSHIYIASGKIISNVDE